MTCNDRKEGKKGWRAFRRSSKAGTGCWGGGAGEGGGGERVWRRNSYHNHWDLRIFNKVRKITKQFWKLKCTYEFFFSSHKYWIAVTWVNRALYMRINMETRNYIHCVVVYFAKKQWTAIVYIFFNITLHKQMKQFDT